jgi:hypothetical protein
MDSQNNTPFQRENAYDLLNNMIKKELSEITFYHIITKERYKIIGIETTLDTNNYLIKILNIDEKKYEKIKNHELKNLEVITNENHP